MLVEASSSHEASFVFLCRGSASHPLPIQQLVQSSSVSEETSKKIEEEVRKLIQQGMDDARDIMTKFRDQWSALAEALLEYETLTGDEIRDLIEALKKFESKDYLGCLSILFGVANQSSTSGIYELRFWIGRLRKGFEKNGMYRSAGPGVMLLHLASNFATPDEMLRDHKENVIRSLYEEIELDLRGGLQLCFDHATICVGEAKAGNTKYSRNKARRQLRIRLRFLKHSVEVIFPDKFKDFICIGRIFVPKLLGNSCKEDEDDAANSANEDGVSFYFHRV